MIHDYLRNYTFNKRKLKSWGSRIEAAKKSQKFQKGLNIVTITNKIFLPGAPIAQMADIGFKVVLLERLNQKWKPSAECRILVIRTNIKGVTMFRIVLFWFCFCSFCF